MKIVKVIRIISIVITMISIFSIFQPEAQAVQSFDEMKRSIADFIEKGKGGNSNINGGQLGGIVMPIVNILTAIGVIVLVGVTMIMGIKYMFATPEEAAKLKQQLIGLVVSAVVILGATAVWKIVYQIVSQLE